MDEQIANPDGISQGSFLSGREPQSPQEAGRKTLAERFLDLSERKMQLIKRLLSPEEYSSLASHLFSESNYSDDNPTTPTTSLRLDSMIAPGYRSRDSYTEHSSSILVDNWKERSVRESLAKKRESNDFFFGHQDKQSSQPASLELRLGHSMNHQTEGGKTILECKTSMPLLCAQANLMDLDSSCLKGFVMTPQQLSSPLATIRNQAVMIQRLKNEKILDKLESFHRVDGISEECPTTKVPQTKQLMSFQDILQPVGPMALTEDLAIKGTKTNLLNDEFTTPRYDFDEGFVIIVRLLSIKLAAHPDLGYEEHIASKLSDCGRELDLLKEISIKLASKLVAKLRSIAANGLDPNQLSERSKLLIVMNQLMQVIEKMKNMQKETMIMFHELNLMRGKQGFNSTTISVEQEDTESRLLNLGKSLEDLTASFSCDEGLKESLDACTLIIKESDQNFVVKFKERGLDEGDLDDDEQVRRLELRRWVESLSLYFETGHFSHRCSLNANCDNSFILGIDSENQVKIPLASWMSSQRLGIKLFSGGAASKFWSIFWRPKLIAEGAVTIDSECAMRHSVNLECSTGRTVQLVLESEPSTRRVKQPREELIDLLHAHLLPSSSALLDQQTKIYQLMKNVDHQFILEILGSANDQSYFQLSLNEDLSDTSKRDVPSPIRIRSSLLEWRWVNNLRQVVYLNSQENEKKYGLRVEQFRSKLKEIAATPTPLVASTSIEVARARASDYIKKLETKLLNSDRSKLDARQHNGEEIISADTMLLQPKLSMDFSALANLVSILMPRPTARRPLKAQKEARKWAALRANWFGANSMDMHTHKTHSSLIHPRLVVNLQGATNVPILVPRTHSRPLTPIHPGLSPTPVSVISGGSQTLGYLRAATSYVELLFQQHQVASSLAQGKDPVWNETLSLPISVPKEAETPDSSLVDEFLQISLYDYHCYTEEPTIENYPSSNLIGPTITSAPSSILGVQRVLTSSQRVERHLLGSLRIPLGTLISAGKIEGSFTLEQPILFENHRFGLDSFNIQGFEHPEIRVASPLEEAHSNSQDIRVRLFITLDSPITLDKHDLEMSFDSREPELLFRYTQLWEKTFSKRRVPFQTNSNKRSSLGASTTAALHVRALVLLSDGNYVIMSRLLHPLALPPKLLYDIADVQARMRALARFVSLLTPLKYGVFQHSRALASTLWFESNQLVTRCLGGPEEKAVLLCNYFLSLGRYSGLLLGDSIQEGRCVYVIVWNNHLPKSPLESELQVEASQLFESMRVISENQDDNILSVNNFSPFSTSIPSNASISMEFWNPNSGSSYEHISLSPLVSIGAVVTADNVYANLQTSVPISSMNFNINLDQLWFPLLARDSSSSLARNKRLRGPSGAESSWIKQCTNLEHSRRMLGLIKLSPILSPADIHYEPTMSEDDCEQLRVTIEREVKAHLLKWRPQRPTYFNRSLSRSIQNWLSRFEDLLSRGEQSTEWRQELARRIKSEPLAGFRVASTSGTRQLISCPINMAYIGLKVILDTVYASGVPNADLILGSSNSQTQFIVTCHIKSYPARVISVWLYVAAILTSQA